MKSRWLALAMILSLLTLSMSATAQVLETQTLQGLITEVADGYIVITDSTYGEVRVNQLESITEYDGIAAKDSLVVGQYVFVTYNGVMSRSLPPQVTALKIGCYVVNGTVAEILTDGFTVEGDSVIGTVIIHADEPMPTVFQGVPITIYYAGVMALSYPPQIYASYIVVPMFTGTVSDIASDSFTLTDAQGETHPIMLTVDTQMGSLLAEGEQVNVYYNGELTEDQWATALRVASLTADGAEETASVP